MTEERVKKEARLRNWLRANKGDWHLSWIEPSHGSTVGVPDVMAITPAGKVILLELKWVALGPDDRPKMNVRPEQKVWHRMAAARRVASGFLVAVELPLEISVALGRAAKGEDIFEAGAMLSRRVAKQMSSGSHWWEKHITNVSCDWWVRKGWIPAVFSSEDMNRAEKELPRMKAVYTSSDLAFAVSRW